MNKKTLVISAFPGCGKTYFTTQEENKKFGKLICLDSDSSNFSWQKDSDGKNTKERNPEFPENYINHIKQNIGTVDVIFVSSHLAVREALKKAKINFIVIHPKNSLDCKIEWVNRYVNRGSSIEFINLLTNKFEEWIEELKADKELHRIELNSDEYISTKIINKIRISFLPKSDNVLVPKEALKKYLEMALCSCQYCPLVDNNGECFCGCEIYQWQTLLEEAIK